jgi:hypothetical protein
LSPKATSTGLTGRNDPKGSPSGANADGVAKGDLLTARGDALARPGGQSRPNTEGNGPKGLCLRGAGRFALVPPTAATKAEKTDHARNGHPARREAAGGATVDQILDVY